MSPGEKEKDYMQQLFDIVLDTPDEELLEAVLRKIVDAPVPEDVDATFAETTKFALVTGYTVMHDQAAESVEALMNLLANYEENRGKQPSVILTP